jgi:hypothetical protein
MDASISHDSIHATVYLIILLDHSDIASIDHSGEIFGFYCASACELLGPYSSLGQPDRISSAGMG